MEITNANRKSKTRLTVYFLFFITFLSVALVQIKDSKETKAISGQDSISKLLAHLYVSSTPDMYVDPSKVESQRQVVGGYFNLGANQYAELKLKLPESSLTSSYTNWITISRNNIFTPITLQWINKQERHQKSFTTYTRDNKHLRVQVPKQFDNGTLTIRLTGKYLRGQLNVRTDATLIEQLKITSALSGLYYGFTGLVVLLSLLLAVSSKQQVFVSYAALLSLTMLWIAAGEGWVINNPNAPYPFLTANSLGLMFFVASGSFSKRYLQLKIIAPYTYKLIGINQVTLCIIWLGYCLFFNKVPDNVYQVLYALTLLTGLFLLLLNLLGGFNAVKKGRTQAKFYLGAIAVLLVFALLGVLSISNLIYFAFGWPTVQFVSLVEVLILTTGFILWNQQKHRELAKLGLEFRKLVNRQELTQSELDKLKLKMSENLLPPTLTPHIAKVVSLLPDTLFIKACGNYAEVHHIKNKLLKKTFVDCSLQSIEGVITGQQLLRCHKSYLVNLNRTFELQRRNSADFDLSINDTKVPVGRSYLNRVRIALKTQHQN